MEVDNVNPSQINSLLINEIQETNVIDLKKKRKLQAELLGLPIAKLKCSDGSLPSKSLSLFDEYPEADELVTNIIKGIAEGGATDGGSELESAKDSNSFAEQSDSFMSTYCDSKFPAENGKTWSYDRSLSSSFSLGSCSFKDSCYSSDSAVATEGGSGKEQFTFVGEEHHSSHHVDELEIIENLDEHLTECGSHVEYLCAGYGHDGIEQFKGNEIEDILHSNEKNPNMYVLSSGRWSVNQETQQGKRKPTIDQEFEQYFSMLML